MIRERAHDLQTCQDAVGAVETAAVGLGVEMAANEHGRARGVGPGPLGEEIADAVARDRAARSLGPGGEQRLAVAVGVRERDSMRAAARRGAHLGEGHQALPEAIAVDARHGQSRRSSVTLGHCAR